MSFKAFSADLAVLLGRILIAQIFLISGVMKIMHFSMNVDFIVSKGLPYPGILLVLAIIAELLGGLLILLGWKIRWGALILGIFIIATLVMIHNFWNYPAVEVQTQLIQFMKNLSILGAIMYIFAYGAGRFSIDGK